MEEKYKILLNKEKSVKSVNETSHVPLNLENSNKIIPLSNEQTVVNSYEQFEKERRELPAVSLNSDTATITSISNDYDVLNKNALRILSRMKMTYLSLI